MQEVLVRIVEAATQAVRPLACTAAVIAITGLFTLTYAGTSGTTLDKEEPLDWSPALEKWKEFSSRRIAETRQAVKRYGGPLSEESEFVEIRSALHSAYLPSYRAFTDGHALFLLHVSGDIAGLGDGTGSLDYLEGRRVTRFSRLRHFLEGAQLVVTSSAAAIETKDLIKELLRAPTRFRQLVTNTKTFSVFDTSFLCGMFCDASNWKSSAEKKSASWVVRDTYFGPPVDTSEPWEWIIAVDDKNVVIDVFQRSLVK